ncbi:bifunctional 4-hydroxy-2-oxoglutarate aldolase/2-dehydro-3-deoxy-phosphogluconate aldolase [Herbiconiux sp. KACC 21604]|uniref:bifunctional 4-hydroxy-2-oxoglutarate aldolase/2-dehydro-3-deoxy-phosphogluconate aldolase n=1 Tax=unclassified Herbiconiux TaxID=2618217 RepID=UPI001492D393|nr:bifunctional 4-hydroxy-2-oxoglutarate aldolase/2-dehydro-3-deoxy-phosphogluconate aldolase [Herbiconiux sp. SALV-R1]QJU55738.1 bifunctional 4-hydroxy-2-oxoglutarate aldolase/2-dehydro-3-deoxy-phosphogluconate aldolase [Herbiconiux sp. SALV-R1]WPO86946.1 bifunctional 4-hydroxy-2-oxoglutarate aldolase/2-dehydro-3-deoxy-phosphogluconate aldolase [Herbiconiux sp. KACC 21604]
MTATTLIDRAHTVDALRATRLVAVVRASDAASAVRGVDSLVAGGVRGIEITFTTPGATEAIAEIARRHGDEVVLGAGTVTRPEQAGEAVEAGATFLVSPGTHPSLTPALRSSGAALLLGALSPSDVLAALAEGADVVKLFPASLGGPAYLRSLRGPFPEVDFCPTGGVNPETIPAWLDAGAVVLGAGSELCSRARLDSGDWEGITETARRFVAALPQ